MQVLVECRSSADASIVAEIPALFDILCAVSKRRWVYFKDFSTDCSF